MTNDQREIHRKKRILEYAERVGNIAIKDIKVVETIKEGRTIYERSREAP
ncbi:MAG: hypothetical protein JRG93_17400 [Deltaproteobacteria bacterium]|nr:hypothetical protein [Deltaproteobacteria bacterium]MBW2223159.1 hypothetical protein [Deltaproteobacteria bacterium]MBW2548086.1 hypothetical protein [Deltaproteobacteria bacterium]MBW2718294.1 hypothetical protein [Deltaproteobacteria bacterium]